MLIVVRRISRSGSNARNLLNNHDELRGIGIELHSISVRIDFGTKQGKAMLGRFAIMAELERGIITGGSIERRPRPACSISCGRAPSEETQAFQIRW
jgi:DNA invertase Pin-like site-specific DNA recombinase